VIGPMVMYVGAAVGAIIAVFGLIQSALEHSGSLHSQTRGGVGAFIARMQPKTRTQGRRKGEEIRLPRVLSYLKGAMRQAGVDWDVSSIVGLILATSLGCAIAAWLVTGIDWLALIALGVGFWAPLARLRGVAKKRAERVMKQLDQVCMELILAVSSGLDLFTALRDQAMKAPEPTGTELRRVISMAQSMPLPDAIPEFGDRVDLEEARLFAVGIRLAISEGAQVVPVLDSILRSLRGRRELQGLITELSAQHRQQSRILAFIPVILMPALRLVDPAMTYGLFHTFGGQVIVVIDIVWMMFGLTIVQKWFGGVQA